MLLVCTDVPPASAINTFSSQSKNGLPLLTYIQISPGSVQPPDFLLEIFCLHSPLLHCCNCVSHVSQRLTVEDCLKVSTVINRFYIYLILQVPLSGPQVQSSRQSWTQIPGANSSLLLLHSLVQTICGQVTMSGLSSLTMLYLLQK